MEQTQNKIFLKDKMNEFRNHRKQEYASHKELIALKSCFHRYLQHNDTISHELIHDYLDNFNTIKDSSKKVYRRFLTQLLRFINEEHHPCRSNNSSENKLREIALNSSFVDSDGILRVNHSNVPAPFAWINVLRDSSDVNFDYNKSRIARKDHNDQLECDYELFKPAQKKRRFIQPCNITKITSIS